MKSDLLKLEAMPQNYKQNIDWIIGAYLDSGVTFPDGFQKDAIQNCVGARKNHQWNNFKCLIYIVENEYGCFLIVEDCGTLGLTGHNYEASTLKIMMQEGTILGPDERLARFSSMFNSGGNTTGGGLYGAGKSVLAAASETCSYFYDSLREDGLYVANENYRGQIHPKAFENEDAKKFIFSKTGLAPKETNGTRVIIENPKEELVASIKTGEIVKFVQESWWRIIQRMPDDSGIYINGKKVCLPDHITKASRIYKLPNQEYFSDEYKVKHFGLYIYEDGGNDWNGISYYRLGMKIGSVELKEIPEKISGKFWGYIEVDEPWEKELAEIEDKIHFGVSKGKKGRTSYQNLKKYCDNKFNECLIDWGIIKENKNFDRKLQEKLNEIAENVQDLFENMGFDKLDEGTKKADFDIRLQNVLYPEEGNEKVTTGDSINFDVKFSSTYNVDKKIQYSIFVKNVNTGESLPIFYTEKINLKPDVPYIKNLSFKVNKNNSYQFEKNKICIEAKVVSSNKTKVKELVFYYDMNKESNDRELATVYLNSINLPNKNKRVNFGQEISEISYCIDNKRNYQLNCKLKVSIHNASDPTCPKIADLISHDGVLEPFETEIVSVPNVLIDKALFSQYLEKGVLELRARLLANDDSGDYEKGDRIAKYNFPFYLNMNDRNGKKDAFVVQSIDNKDRHQRAWHDQQNGVNTIYINVGHPAYNKLENYPEIQDDYLNEQLLKEYLQLYIEAEKYDLFNYNERIFANSEPQEATELMLRKLEEVYYNSLK